MKFTPAPSLVKSEINTHLDADKLVRKMTFTPGKIVKAKTKMSFTPGRIAQTKINQPKVTPTPSLPKQDYVVISVTETVLDPVSDPYVESLPIEQPTADPNAVTQPAIENPVETVMGDPVYEMPANEVPVVEVSTDLAAAIY